MLEFAIVRYINLYIYSCFRSHSNVNFFTSYFISSGHERELSPAKRGNNGIFETTKLLKDGQNI